MAVSILGTGNDRVRQLSNADSATGWTANTISGAGGGASLLASVGTIDIVAEGTDARATRVNKQRVEIYFTDSAGWDFTTGSTGTGATKVPDGLFYIWNIFLAFGSAATEASGGMQITLGDGTNEAFWNVGGSDTYDGKLTKFALDPTVTPDSGSVTLGDVTKFGFVCDVGGNTTRFDNMVVDSIDIGNRHTVQGTTTSDALFSELNTVVASSATGTIRSENGILFCQTNLDLNGTALTSESETLVFTDTLQGTYTYTFDVTGTVTFTNTQINAAGAVDYAFDASTATAFTMNGGALINFASAVFASGQTVSGALLQDGGLITVNNTLSNCTITGCDIVQIESGAGITNSTISNAVGTAYAMSVANAAATANITNVTINDHLDGTGTAVRVFAADTETITWDISTPNGAYDTGVTGNGVQVTGGSITGNEHLFIPAGTGTITVSVQDGATVPSVASNGATVNVVANQVTVSVNVKDDTNSNNLQNAGVYIHEDGNTSNVYINGMTDASGNISSSPFAYSSDINVVGWVRQMDLSGTDYVARDVSGTITSNGLSLNVRLTPI